ERSHKAKADAQGWVTLPADGRAGPEPAFPRDCGSPREPDLWARLWEPRQAGRWEHLLQGRGVASYVRLLARAELPPSSALVGGRGKQFAESLGLSVSGMQRNRWVVAKRDDDDTDSDAPKANAQVSSLTERLRAVHSE